MKNFCGKQHLQIKSLKNKSASLFSFVIFCLITIFALQLGLIMQNQNDSTKFAGGGALLTQ